jgi:transcriptional regulator with XRE-family HTH domain
MSTIFGDKIKTLREEKQIPQRQIAAALEIDTATYCKIEKGDRRAKREQLTILADLFEVNLIDLLRLWSADKVYEIIAEEEEPIQILNVVAENIAIFKQKTAKI